MKVDTTTVATPSVDIENELLIDFTRASISTVSHASLS